MQFISLADNNRPRAGFQIGDSNLKEVRVERHFKDGSYEQSLKNWRSKSSNYPGKYRRPKDAENWLADLAMAEKRKATAARSKFFTWLFKQSDRDDPVGDLSKDCLRDNGFPVSLTTPERLRRHPRHRGACDEALVVLDEALKSSRRARRGGLALVGHSISSLSRR